MRTLGPNLYHNKVTWTLGGFRAYPLPRIWTLVLGELGFRASFFWGGDSGLLLDFWEGGGVRVYEVYGSGRFFGVAGGWGGGGGGRWTKGWRGFCFFEVCGLLFVFFFFFFIFFLGGGSGLRVLGFIQAWLVSDLFGRDCLGYHLRNIAQMNIDPEQVFQATIPHKTIPKVPTRWTGEWGVGVQRPSTLNPQA